MSLTQIDKTIWLFIGKCELVRNLKAESKHVQGISFSLSNQNDGSYPIADQSSSVWIQIHIVVVSKLIFIGRSGDELWCSSVSACYS